MGEGERGGVGGALGEGKKTWELGEVIWAVVRRHHGR